MSFCEFDRANALRASQALARVRTCRGAIRSCILLGAARVRFAHRDALAGLVRACRGINRSCGFATGGHRVRTCAREIVRAQVPALRRVSGAIGREVVELPHVAGDGSARRHGSHRMDDRTLILASTGLLGEGIDGSDCEADHARRDRGDCEPLKSWKNRQGLRTEGRRQRGTGRLRRTRYRPLP